MRCFIALNLPQEVKDHLFELQRTTKTKDATIHWVAKKNLHLTLKFLGEINQEKVEEIKQRLHKLTFKKINVHINTIGFFPDEEAPRVVWIGIQPEAEIVKLAQLIDEETLDLVSGEQQFTAHLTLGRIKNIKSREKLKNVLKEMTVQKLSFTIDSFTLYKSTLSDQGPTYSMIENYELK